MILYRRTLCPNGHVIAVETELAQLSPDRLTPYESLFGDGLSASGQVPSAPEVSFEWTGVPDGQAMLTCKHDGRLALCDVLIAGRSVPQDNGMLRGFMESVARRMGLELANGPWPN